MDDGTSSGYAQNAKTQYEYFYKFREDKKYENSRNVTVRMASNCYLHSLTQGSTVGYRQVTTLYGANGENGKTVSKFVSPFEVRDIVVIGLPFPPATSYDYQRGALLEATDYKMVSGQYVHVKMIQNTYAQTESSIEVNKIGLAIGGEEWQPPLLMTPVPDMNRYALGRYLIILGLSRPSRTIETTYENNASFSKDVTLTYDAAMQFLKTKVEKVSNGKEIVTENFYPQDFVFSSGPILELKATHRFPLLEQLVSERGSDGIKKTISGSYMEYGYFGQLLLPSKLYKLTATAPLTNFSGVANTPNGTLNAAYKEVSSYVSYDAQGNIQQVKPRERENEYYIWGYNNTALVAKVQNATIDKVAYCDFESTDTGGWTFSNSATNYSTDARTGKRSFKGSTITRNITQGTYKLSFWAKAPAGMGTVNVNGLDKNIGSNWTYCEWQITPDQIIINPAQYFIQYSGSVSITLNGNLIDGLRLHPKGSLMETYTYDPLVGLTSASSANNTTVYYEYDALGRLSVIRDNNKNIVKSYQYQVAPRQ